MTSSTHKISRQLALLVALVVLAAAALLAGNGQFHSRISYSANGTGHTPVTQPSNGGNWRARVRPSNGQYHKPVQPANGHSWN